MRELTTVRALRAALGDDTVELTGRAARATAALDSRCSGPRREWRHLLVLVEGIASAGLHGVRAPLLDVLLARFGGRHETAAMAVADTITVVADAVAAESAPTAATLQAWHRKLMRRAPTVERRQIGRWRDIEVPGAASPSDIPRLVDDLLAFAARRNPDGVAHAAAVAARFDEIRPFAGGNGRIGRALASAVLVRRLGVGVPPPVSFSATRDAAGRAAAFAHWQRGDVDAWVRWYASTVLASADEASRLLGRVSELAPRWRRHTDRFRSDSVVHPLIEALPGHIVYSVPSASEVGEVTSAAARLGLIAIAETGVLVEIDRTVVGTGPARRWWIAPDLVDAIRRWT